MFWWGLFCGLVLGLLAASGLLSSITARCTRIFSGQKSEEFGLEDLILNQSLGPPATAWANVGLWRDTGEFIQANAALARDLAAHTGLDSSSAVLDVGFGMGQQIDLWFKEFGIKSCIGLNISASQVRFALQHLDCWASKLDLQQAPHTKINDYSQRFHQVICVDCCYHFSDFLGFAAAARSCLRPGGSFGFHFINLQEERASWLLHRVMRLGGIPKENIMSTRQMEQALRGVGYSSVAWNDLSAAVFPGFEAFLGRFIAEQQDHLKSLRLFRYRSTYWFLRLFARPNLRYNRWILKV